MYLAHLLAGRLHQFLWDQSSNRRAASRHADTDCQADPKVNGHMGAAGERQQLPYLHSVFSTPADLSLSSGNYPANFPYLFQLWTSTSKLFHSQVNHICSTLLFSRWQQWSCLWKSHGAPQKRQQTIRAAQCEPVNLQATLGAKHALQTSLTVRPLPLLQRLQFDH